MAVRAHLSCPPCDSRQRGGSGSRLELRWCSWGRGKAAAWPGRDSGAAEQRGRGGAGAPRGGAVLVRRLGLVAAFGVRVRVQGGPLGPIKGRAPGIAGYSWGRGSPAAAPEIADADVARAGIRRKGTGLNRGPGLAETQRRARVVRVKRAEREKEPAGLARAWKRGAGLGRWTGSSTGLVWVLGFSFSISFVFLNQTLLQPFEFK